MFSHIIIKKFIIFNKNQSRGWSNLARCLFIVSRLKTQAKIEWLKKKRFSKIFFCLRILFIWDLWVDYKDSMNNELRFCDWEVIKYVNTIILVMSTLGRFLMLSKTIKCTFKPNILVMVLIYWTLKFGAIFFRVFCPRISVSRERRPLTIYHSLRIHKCDIASILS
jgi:hypothetical protein